MALFSKIHAYLEAHWDHFMISIGVSVAITIISNVIIHYMADLMRLLHWSEHLIHLLTNA